MRNIILASAVMVGFVAFAAAPAFSGKGSTHNSSPANSGRGPVALGGGGPALPSGVTAFARFLFEHGIPFPGGANVPIGPTPPIVLQRGP